jgi:hypothetical protein
MSRGPGGRSFIRGATLPLLGGLALLGAFGWYAAEHWAGLVLELGSIQEPTQGFLELATCLTYIGVPAVALFVRAALVSWPAERIAG